MQADKHRYKRREAAHVCLYDDQVPRYLLVVESFPENYSAEQCQRDVKGSVCCLQHIHRYIANTNISSQLRSKQSHFHSSVVFLTQAAKNKFILCRVEMRKDW